MKKILYCFLVSLIVSTLYSPNILAFAYDERAGNICVWEENPVFIHDLTYHGDVGSGFYWADYQAIAKWDQVPSSMYFPVFTVDYPSQDTIDLHDRVNEITEISWSDINDITNNTDLLAIVHAITYRQFYFTPSRCKILSADVLINANLDFAKGDYPDDVIQEFIDLPMFSVVYRRTILHELGHALGLKHTQDYGWMVADPPYGTNALHPGYIEYSNFDPNLEAEQENFTYWPLLPDDKEGASFLYPGYSAETDWTGSTLFYVNDTLERFFSAPSYLPSDYNDYTGFGLGGVCPGQEVSFYKTLLNNGSTSFDFRVNYYLSQDENIDTNDLLLKTTMVSGLGGYEDFTNLFKVRMPINPGSVLSPPSLWYYFGMIIDPQNQIPEDYETNNVVLLGQVAFDDEEHCIQAVENPYQHLPPMMRYRDYQGYYATATRIFYGRVLNVRSQKMEDESVYTYYDMAVLDHLKGSGTNRLTIRQYGGNYVDEHGGTIIVGFDHAPTLEKGQEYVIFLGRNNYTLIPFVNGTDGVLKVKTDSLNSRKKIVTTYSDIPFAAWDGKYFYTQTNMGDICKDCRERDENGKDVSMPLFSTDPKSQTYSLDSFLNVLRQEIKKYGPYEPIVYKEIPPTKIKLKRMKRE